MKKIKVISVLTAIALLMSIMSSFVLTTYATDLPKYDYTGDYGKLSVDKNSGQLVGENGKPAKLVGVNSHGLQWDLSWYCNENSMKFMRDYWKVNTIRANVYVFPGEDGYLLPENMMSTQKEFPQGVPQGIALQGWDIKKRIWNSLDKIITTCLSQRMYVIIDWHTMRDNDPNYYKSDAKEFFKKVVELYGSNPNFDKYVLFEIANEPNSRPEDFPDLQKWLSMKGKTVTQNVTWKNHIKPYAEDVISYIRNDLKKNNICIVPLPYWSQRFYDVDPSKGYAPIRGNDNDVIANPLDPAKYSNFMYKIAYYAGNDHSNHLPALKEALSKKMPVFGSEIGFSDVGGIHDFNPSSSDPVDQQIVKESNDLLKLFDENNISWTIWALPAQSFWMVKEGKPVNHLALLKTRPEEPYEKQLEVEKKYKTCSEGWNYDDFTNMGKFFYEYLTKGGRTLTSDSSFVGGPAQQAQLGGIGAQGQPAGGAQSFDPAKLDQLGSTSPEKASMLKDILAKLNKLMGIG